MGESDPIRILVVDDTTLFRKVLSDVVETLPGALVVGTAASGEIALRKLEKGGVDLVLLDVFMPELNGVETLKAIRGRFPGVDVVMISGVSTRHTATTIEALELGALDFIRKPEESGPAESARLLAEHLRPVLRMVEIRRLTRTVQSRRRVETLSVSPRPAGGSRRISRIDMVLIGVSTGGPNALSEVIPRLPSDLGVPVLIVQHMPPVFTASLAEHLAKLSSLAVREAREGERLEPGTVLLAPGGRHMIVRPVPGVGKVFSVAITDTQPVNSCRPSVDVLFKSVANAGCGGCLIAILTGMGDDGADGVADLKRMGAYCLAQEAATCVVYGMPRAIVERGLSDEIVPLEGMADRIVAIVKRPGLAMKGA